MLDTSQASLRISDVGRVLAKLENLATQLAPGERAAIDLLLRAAGIDRKTPVQFNPFLPGVHACPYAHYHQLQSANPVHWSESIHSWVVCRYDDVAAALRDRRLSSRTGARVLAANVPEDERAGVQGVSTFLASLLNEIDPPEHTRMRRLMTRALAATLSGRPRYVETIANQLLDAVESAQRMDLVADYAYPLPSAVGATLVGVPVEDRRDFERAVGEVVRTFSDGFSRTAAMQRGEAAVVAVLDRLNCLLTLRRARPDNDLLSALLSIPDATDAERVLVAANLVLGTQENVTHAISLLTRALIQGKADPALLCDRPELIAPAVEEALRYEGTAPLVSRITMAETEIGGVRIPAGQPVTLLLAAANRDPARFSAPDSFDPSRSGTHLAFGAGRRACPGAGLARMMVLIGVRTLLTRFTAMELTDPQPVWREEINVHGLAHMWISFQPRAGEKRQTTGGDLGQEAER